MQNVTDNAVNMFFSIIIMRNCSGLKLVFIIHMDQIVNKLRKSTKRKKIVLKKIIYRYIYIIYTYIYKVRTFDETYAKLFTLHEFPGTMKCSRVGTLRG